MSERAKWLTRAKAILRKDIQEHTPLLWRTRVFVKPLPKILLGRTIWEPDKPKYARILISPRIRSGTLALAVLLHELVHVTTPLPKPAHGKEFRRIAHPLGLLPPYSIVQNISEELRVRLVEVRNQLGPYPKD